MSEVSTDVVIVEIFGQRYPVRSRLDRAYVTKLASYVDQKMQMASDRARSGDSVRVAVLAALNIADEYFRARDPEDGHARRLALELEHLVDSVLAQDSPPS